MHAPRHLPLAETLGRIARQLRAMEANGRAIEDALFARPGGAAALDPALQTLDHLVQSLDALAGYVGLLAQRVCDETPVEVAEAGAQIKLRAVAEALTGTPAPCAIAQPDPGGDVMLF